MAKRENINSYIVRIGCGATDATKDGELFDIRFG